MNSKGKIKIFLNETISQNIGISKIERELAHVSDDDSELLKLAYDLDLNLYFYDINNYTLDYAMASHVAVLAYKDMTFVAIPHKLSLYQRDELMNLEGELIQKNLIVYSFEKDNTLQNLHIYYKNNDYLTNQAFLDQIVATKEIVISSKQKILKK